MVWIECFVVKNSDTTSWHEVLHHFSLFCNEFCKVTKCTQIVQNTPKHEFIVPRGGSSAFVAKNSDATSWHELLHKLGLF